MTLSAAAGLEEVVGRERVLRDAAERRRWSVGDAVPEAVVLPRSVQEMADVVGRASEEGWPLVPAGEGSWLRGGGVPRDARLVVSTREMDGIVEYEPGDLTLTAGAGLSLGELGAAAGERGQWLPQDPPDPRRSTLGAFVSTGIPGPLAAGFGRPRDLLLGLTAVTGDGRVVRPGGRVVKNVAGYDLVRLLAGSWGTLAVIVEATVRLFPLPERDLTLLFRGHDARELVPLARTLAGSPLAPDALELLVPGPRDGTAPEGRGGTGRRSGPGAAIAVRLLGSPEAADGKARALLREAGNEPDGRLEGSGSAAFHERRARASGDPDGLSVRMTLLPARLERLVEEAEGLRSLARERGLGARFAVHLTRGTLRLDVGPGPDGGATGDGWAGPLAACRRRIEDAGGSLVALTGPPAVTEAVGPRSEPGAVGRILEGLKRELDPAGILAPGRLGLPGTGP